MSFWKTFGFHTVSAIDTILDGGDYTLEQLLDEEEILQETKSQNKKLIDFIIEPESLKTLLSYITVEPSEDADQKRKYKYPFLACEILASEVWAICDAFYAEESLLDELYSFLDKPPPLNPMLASYTSRVASVLLQKKVNETIAYMKEKKNIIKAFVMHLGNASVMDLLLKVIACEDISEGAGILEWLCQTDLIQSLVNKFDPSLGDEVIENASQALVDIIAVSMNSSSSPLIAQLESDEMIKTLFKHTLSRGLSTSLENGLNVIIELLRRHQNEDSDTKTKIEELPPLLRTVCDNLEKFNSFLTTNSEVKKISLSAIGEITPLGFHRLKIIEFFAVLVRCNYKCIDEALIKLNVFSSCLDLFFAYPWNNFLHSAVGQMIEGIFLGQNEELKISLIKDSKILDKICMASDENETAKARPVGVRRGYMGHITLLSLTIIERAEGNSELKNLLQNHQRWQSYVKGPFNTTQERENIIIGGYMPPDFQDDQDEFDQPEISFDTEQEKFNEEDDTIVQGQFSENDDNFENETMEVQSETEVWEKKDASEQEMEIETKEEKNNPSSVKEEEKTPDDNEEKPNSLEEITNTEQKTTEEQKSREEEEKTKEEKTSIKEETNTEEGNETKVNHVEQSVEVTN